MLFLPILTCSHLPGRRSLAVFTFPFPSILWSPVFFANVWSVVSTALVRGAVPFSLLCRHFCADDDSSGMFCTNVLYECLTREKPEVLQTYLALHQFVDKLKSQYVFVIRAMVP